MTASRYRGSAAVWMLLLAYASLYPFVPLRPPVAEALGNFILKPRYLVFSDVVWNVLAYVPLGLLARLHFIETRGAAGSLARAVGLAAVFSFAMELGQLFVPTRVSSIYDVLANSAGALLGALAFSPPMRALAAQPLGALRERVLIAGAWGDAGLVLLALWLLAQLNPALPFFGAGDIGSAEGEVEALKVFAVALSVCGFGLFVSVLTAGSRGSLRATLVLLSLALWLKFAAASVMLQPHFAEGWLGAGRVVGLAVGIIAFALLRHIALAARMYLGLVALLAGALFAKIFGAYSPMEEFLRVFRWSHGQLAGFATLTRLLQEAWPFLAIAYLAACFLRVRRDAIRP
jgi:VanZ family protein